MQEYNLFIIKENINYDGNYLYKILKKLYYLNNDYNYGFGIYNQLCNKINLLRFKNYLNYKYKLHNNTKYIINNSYIELRHSRIIVKTKNINIIKQISKYDNIFVCDFNNNRYFWT